MESVRTVEIFNFSIHYYNLRYSHYLYYGDTVAFDKVIESDPYGDNLTPIKLGCVGHLQTRLGTKLRMKRKGLIGQLLSDEKKNSRPDCVTDRAINTMQN